MRRALVGQPRTLPRQTQPVPASRLLTQAPGYVLHVDDDEFDLARFRTAGAHGHTLLATGSWERASRTLREALDLWRGEVLADLVEEGMHWPELTSLRNLRLNVIEDWSEAEISIGRYHQVVPHLEAVVESEPLRERACYQLMLALYRCGRQADALGVYRRTRAILVERFGLDPGHDLRRLEHAILNQDPTLVGPRRTGRPLQRFGAECAFAHGSQ
ncbi:AfsR/SARP family transcriptional regulator [Frankia sp. Mgl5]|uniref:AfsR/SARP family transcriptional regulator n=1 Tax=Frankia sp. Mgl5 TaxID=2933793 RepID=UPI00200BECBB|nr:AfsR/SARP family transcriptional regulator [Frankia sp. Mgl5]MCK9931096.1 AfsR/SARP family transcriptional regulator [Frankia sp. Mgl5]